MTNEIKYLINLLKITDRFSHYYHEKHGKKFDNFYYTKHENYGDN